jgi:hypothetical protein
MTAFTVVCQITRPDQSSTHRTLVLEAVDYGAAAYIAADRLSLMGDVTVLMSEAR